jgi:hypothetical protein
MPWPGTRSLQNGTVYTASARQVLSAPAAAKPLAGAEVLLLPHGEHAHANPDYGCIIAYGRRWKGAAASALAQYGIPAPEGDEEVDVLKVGTA